MESFAAVLRTLLTRIRALQTFDPDKRIAPTTALGERTIYQVPATGWGVSSSDGSVQRPTTYAADARDVAPGKRTSAPLTASRLELTVFELPVPRGLPAT